MPSQRNGQRHLVGRPATVQHRLYIWRYARFSDRWPTRSEWRFILFGRWAGF